MDNKPSHYLYNVLDQDNQIDEGKSGIWTRIGAAWPHGDDKGFSITLDIPLVLSHRTRLVLRARDELRTIEQNETDNGIEDTGTIDTYEQDGVQTLAPQNHD